MKISLFWSRKLKSRKISSACWLSLSFDDRCHSLVEIAGNKFGGTTAGGDDGSNWVVRFVDFR